MAKRTLAICLLLVLAVTSPAQATDWSADAIADVRYGRFNFTDLQRPYDGVDGFAALRLGWWWTPDRDFGAFAELVPSSTSEARFYWQRNVQFQAGVQWYPLARTTFLRALRLHGLAAVRSYYDQPAQAPQEGSPTALQTHDLQAGADFYFDNILDPDESATLATFLYAGYRHTNFALPEYQGLLIAGNAKAGDKSAIGPSIVFPYFLADWTYVPTHPARFWENFLRLGLGIRWHPAGVLQGSAELWRRLNVYADFLANAAWLGVRPAPGSVASYDIRVGLAFATGGLFR